MNNKTNLSLCIMQGLLLGHSDYDVHNMVNPLVNGRVIEPSLKRWQLIVFLLQNY